MRSRGTGSEQSPSAGTVTVLESMGTAYVSLDSADTVSYLNAAGERLFDVTRAEAVGRPVWELLPGAFPVEVGPAFETARLTDKPVVVEVWTSALRRWLQVRVVPASAALAVFLVDVTNQHRAEEAAERAAKRMDLLVRVSGELSSAPDAEEGLRRLAALVVPTLGDWSVVTLMDAEAPGGLRDVGSAHADPALRAAVADYAEHRVSALTDDAPLFRAGRNEKPELMATDAAVVAASFLRPGISRDVLLTLAPESLAILPLKTNGRTVGLLSIFGSAQLDDSQLLLAAEVCARASLAVDNAHAYAAARRAQAAAERSAGLLRLLGDVSELLNQSRDRQSLVEDLARLLVPDLADWCTVTIAADADAPLTYGWAHRDPTLEPSVAKYAAIQATDMRPDSAVATTLRTGRPVILSEIPAVPELVAADQIGGDAAELLRTLAPGSAVVLPLTCGGRTLGALALVTLRERGPYPGDLLATAYEIARRAGLGLDNARLYEEQRDLVEALQRSLLTSPPTDGPLEIVVRYVPAASQAEVGGDWYDALRLPDGDAVLVIGDVMGHDGMAAAKMGQLRGVLRALAYDNSTEMPASVLTRVESALRGLELDTLATGIVARISAGPAGAGRLTWSNAGHPPPVLIHADGSAEVLPTGGDLLLGVDPAAARTDRTIDLPVGSTLLMFTDGLVERRDADLDQGLSRLIGIVADLGGADLDRLCDAVLSRMGAIAGRDDVAMLAARLRV